MSRPLPVILPVLELNDYHRGMTDHAIENLRETASSDVHLIIVETTAGPPRLELAADSHIHVPRRTNLSHDMNIGFSEAERLWRGGLMAYTANDLVLRPGWDNALLEPWEKFEDCGASTLLATTHSADRISDIEEGIYGPLLCLTTRWRFDEERFPNIFGDTDLLMRIYRDGQRSYRNWASTVHHIGGGEQTWRDLNSPEAIRTMYDDARLRFFKKHKDCGLQMFRALLEGWRV